MLPQAVERLNLKPKNFKDLITDEPFKRSDIITLQVRLEPGCVVYPVMVLVCSLPGDGAGV